MKISLADAYLLSLSSVEFCEPKLDCWSRPSMAPCGSWSEQALDGLGIHVACIQNEVARRALCSPRGDKRANYLCTIVNIAYYLCTIENF